MAEPPIDQDGVTLRDPEDFDTLRSDIFEGVKAEIATAFPKSYGGVRLEVNDLAYEGKEDFTFADQRKALMHDDFLFRKLRGTVRLVDDKTGEVLDEKRQSLMRVPWLSQRGTFLHKGNEYSTISQLRLVPGPYTRRTESGELEGHFNPRPGSGRGFRVSFDPASSQYRLGVQSSQLHLYSLLKDLGHTDEDLEARWGTDVYKANAQKYDARVLPRAYKNLVPSWKHEAGISKEGMAEAVLEALNRTEVNANVARRNLPNWFDRKKSAQWAAKGAGAVASKVLFEKRAASLEFSPDFKPTALRLSRIHDSIQDRSEMILLGTKKASVAVDLDGTLAKRVKGDFDPEVVGEPVPKMMDRVKKWIAEGREVVIFTARAASPKNIPPVKKWLKEQGLPDLKVTCRKTPEIEELWDDRARQVKINTGELVKGASEIPNVEIGERVSTYWGCPHCKDEIHEKGSFLKDAQDLFLSGEVDRPYIHVHGACGGEFIPPPPTLEEQAWLERLKSARVLPPVALEFEEEFEKEAKVTQKSLQAARNSTAEPKSHAQAEAGNYAKGTLWWNGLRIKIENPKGSTRKGLNPDGSISWKSFMHADYGYVTGSRGKDGDEFDVFIGPHLDSEIVFVVDQTDQKTGEFDEHKAVLGCHTEEEAKTLYLKNYEKGWKIGKVRSMTFPQFKQWLRKGKKVKPLSDEKVVKMASDTTGFDPDLDAADMQEAYDAVYGGTKPRLASMKSWPDEWMPPGSDPLGWINWYKDYADGVRTDDDTRQIKRWKAFKARHGAAFKNNPTPRRAFALRYWAIDPLKLIDDPGDRDLFKDKMDAYRAKETERWMREKTANLNYSELQLLANFLNEHHNAGIPLGATADQLEEAIAVFLGADDGEVSALMAASDIASKSAGEQKGCLMLHIPLNDTVRIVKWTQENIPESDLAEQGLERESHVTVLYGFEPDVTYKDIDHYLPGKPIQMKLGRVKRFENDGFDVLVLEVESQDLKELNSKLAGGMGDRVSKSRWDYNPHLTLAYVKPGTCKNLEGHARFDGEVYICDKLVYSSAGGRRKKTLNTTNEA